MRARPTGNKRTHSQIHIIISYNNTAEYKYRQITFSIFSLSFLAFHISVCNLILIDAITHYAVHMVWKHAKSNEMNWTAVVLWNMKTKTNAHFANKLVGKNAFYFWASKMFYFDWSKTLNKYLCLPSNKQHAWCIFMQ